jgi:hypothetical protein
MVGSETSVVLRRYVPTKLSVHSTMAAKVKKEIARLRYGQMRKKRRQRAPALKVTGTPAGAVSGRSAPAAGTPPVPSFRFDRIER